MAIAVQAPPPNQPDSQPQPGPGFVVVGGFRIVPVASERNDQHLLDTMTLCSHMWERSESSHLPLMRSGSAVLKTINGRLTSVMSQAGPVTISNSQRGESLEGARAETNLDTGQHKPKPHAYTKKKAHRTMHVVSASRYDIHSLGFILHTRTGTLRCQAPA